MKIQEEIKNIMKTDREDLTIIHEALVNAITSYVYSTFIFRMKTKPPVVLVPETREIITFLKAGSPFGEWISENLIDKAMEHSLFCTYNHGAQFKLFQEEYVDKLKVIMDLYMLPSIHIQLEDTIRRKFQLDVQEQQTIREDYENPLFPGGKFGKPETRFIVNQFVLQLLLLMNTISVDEEIPETNQRIHMTQHEILTIDSDKALCPIHFNADVFNVPIFERGDKSVTAEDECEYPYAELRDMLLFVTDTRVNFRDHSSDVACCKRGNQYVEFFVSTSPFNKARIRDIRKVLKNHSE